MARRSADGNVVRLRGRALQVRNARVLRREPLCRRCKNKKPQRVTPATQCDHVIPLAQGGVDDETNLQSLCDACHVEKTNEDFGHQVWPTIGKDGWPTQEVAPVTKKRSYSR